MAFIPGKIFFIYKEIMIGVQLPKPTIKHVEMFVGKVLPYNIYIVLVAYLIKGIHKI